MSNEKIGTIGEAFIQKHVELGIDFDAAWDDWQQIQKKLMFVIVDCPEVQLYDDRRFTDRLERLRIRRLAKARLGKRIRSWDVSMLGRLAVWLQAETPVQPYHMERSVVAEWMERCANALELHEGFTEDVAKAKEEASSEALIGKLAQGAEWFAKDHGLWAVPPSKLFTMYVNHVQRLSKTTFECGACGHETVIPVDHSAGNWQQFTKDCPACRRKNFLEMFIHNDGEAYVRGDVEPENGEGDTAVS